MVVRVQGRGGGPLTASILFQALITGIRCSVGRRSPLSSVCEREYIQPVHHDAGNVQIVAAQSLPAAPVDLHPWWADTRPHGEPVRVRMAACVGWQQHTVPSSQCRQHGASRWRLRAGVRSSVRSDACRPPPHACEGGSLGHWKQFACVLGSRTSELMSERQCARAVCIRVLRWQHIAHNQISPAMRMLSTLA